ncbi:MAG TPA: histidine phosphatase family protein [Candidatus Saccharimonadales bacterium]|nr:histidine phosphatase family protein [Candidatus Saccharimonadales bacterium]
MKKLLNNTYYLFRHGQSETNTKRIINGDPSSGLYSFGLTEEGKEQVKEVAKEYKDNSIFAQDSIIFTSDFLRTRQTADIIAEIIRGNHVYTTEKLRERSFGDFENKSKDNLKSIWESDMRNNTERFMHVETTQEVFDRVDAFINELEEKYTNKTIILVSHGDILQILLTGWHAHSPSEHRNLLSIKNAEVRKL